MMPTQRVPAVLQRFVGTSIEVEEIITWRRDPVGTACIGEAAVDVPLSRTQGRFRGTARIADNATGSSMVVDGTVKVAIPLVGGKVEELLQGLLLSALRAQVSLGLEWLAAGRT
jgi:hypothetical protein